MENSDEPEFANPGDGQNPEYYYPGLTKREMLAGMAMQGILASYNSYTPDADDIARMATEYADSLLKALEK